MTHEEEQRAINLADAAGRASCNGQQDLSEKLAAEANKLLSPSVVADAAPVNTGNQELYDMRVLCAEQAVQLRNKELEILSLKSKAGWLETQLDRLRPAAIHPINAVSATAKVEG